MKRNIFINTFVNTKIIILLIIICPLLFIWQGLDFTDTGYYLTNYQQILNDPKSVSYSFAIWLTDIIGGIWILLFGDSLGLLGINIAGVLVIYATTFLSYLLLKPYVDRKYLLAGLLLTFLYTKWVMPLYYNNLTSLFFVASAFFLVNGLKNNRNWQIFISGLILGLNIFIRLPNILGFILISGIFFYGYINKTEVKLQVKQAISFILGYILAILLVIVAMKMLGHYEIFLNSIYTIYEIGADKESHHGIIKILEINIMQYLHLIMICCVGILFVIIVSMFISILKKPHTYYNILLAVASVGIIILALLTLEEPYHRLNLMVTGILYLVLISYIINLKKGDNVFRLILFVGLLILFITPIGSNNGIRNSVYGMWIPIPIVFVYAFRLRRINAEFVTESDFATIRWIRINLNPEKVALLRSCVITSFITLSLVWCFIYTYRDSPNRVEMRYSVEHPRLRGIFTTKERSRVVQELLDEINKYVKEDDYLLAYNGIPMIHFLTKTRPYLYNSWIDGIPSYQLKRMLDNAIDEKTELPVVVRAKFETSQFHWPKVKIKVLSKTRKETGIIIEDFLIQNKYSLIWENEFFEILVPPKV